FEPWWSGWLLMPSYGGWLGGGAVCPLCRETASSETEIGHPLEGRSAVLERGGDWPPARGQVRCPRARRRLVTRSRAGPLSSSEAEIGHPLEGRSAVLERGGDWPPARGQVRCPRARRRCVCAVEGPGGSPRARRRLFGEPERGANGPHAGLL